MHRASGQGGFRREWWIDAQETDGSVDLWPGVCVRHDPATETPAQTLGSDQKMRSDVNHTRDHTKKHHRRVVTSVATRPASTRLSMSRPRQVVGRSHGIHVPSAPGAILESPSLAQVSTGVCTQGPAAQ